MLKINGFISAENFTDLEDKCKISIHYTAANREKLDNYFKNEAERLLADGLKRFDDKINAKRRIFLPAE